MSTQRDVILDLAEFNAVPLSRDNIAAALHALDPLKLASDSVALIAYERVRARLTEAAALLAELQARATVRV
jgi:hypothetical protein